MVFQGIERPEFRALVERIAEAEKLQKRLLEGNAELRCQLYRRRFIDNPFREVGERRD